MQEQIYRPTHGPMTRTHSCAKGRTGDWSYSDNVIFLLKPSSLHLACAYIS